MTNLPLIFRVVVIALCLMGASVAVAARSWQGEGTLIAVDLVANTVTLEEGTFALDSATKIRNPEGVRLGRELVEDRIGDPVSYVARQAVPRPVLRVLILEHPEPEH